MPVADAPECVALFRIVLKDVRPGRDVPFVWTDARTNAVIPTGFDMIPI